MHPRSETPGPLITLTTDFGTSDSYVAAMKGVLATMSPRAQLLDLSHEIPPQRITAAALFLAGAAPCFPPGTVHLAVVDPGVGSKRRPLVIQAGGQYFVGPDNGMFHLLLRELPLEEARLIENPRWMRQSVSATFHGRDVFAPAAAMLANGAPIEEAGAPADALEALEFPEPMWNDDWLLGRIIHIDHFGNLISNIRRTDLGDAPVAELHCSGCTIGAISRTYADAEPLAPLALWGSSGYLEVAVRDGNAEHALGAELGVAIDMRCTA